jgi:hypothetical protein
MAAWHYDLFLIATGPTDVGAVMTVLSSALPLLPSPSTKLLLWGTTEGDRVDFWTGNEPVELLARFDLRNPSEHFRALILRAATQFQFRLLNADDVAVGHTEEALLSDMESSAAQGFVNNPPSDDEDGEEPG